MATKKVEIECCACGSLTKGQDYYGEWIRANCDNCSLVMYDFKSNNSYNVNHGGKDTCDKCKKELSIKHGYFYKDWCGDLCLDCIKKEYKSRNK